MAGSLPISVKVVLVAARGVNLAFYQVIHEPAGTPDPCIPGQFRHGTYTIVPNRSFATLEEVIQATNSDTHYPYADIYAIEAKNPDQAEAIFQTSKSTLSPIRKGTKE